MTSSPTSVPQESSPIRYTERRADLDFATIHGWLTTTYWSPGISRALVEQGFANSRLVIGAYVGARQVGVARALTDTTRFGYVLDVFVDGAFRGRGIARTMVSHLIAHPDTVLVKRWLLATRDAHEVYRPLGFAPLAEPEKWMAIERKAPVGGPS